MGHTLKELEQRNGRRKDRVEIVNLYAWDCGFRDADNKEGHVGYIMPGGQSNTKLTIEEVYAQVREVQNPFFCGQDGMGAHATLRIVDPVIRAYVFDVDKSEPLQLTQENIKKLLEMDSQAQFMDFMNELIVNQNEARQIAYLVENNLLNLDETAGWKKIVIKQHVYNILGVKRYDY